MTTNKGTITISVHDDQTVTIAASGKGDTTGDIIVVFQLATQALTQALDELRDNPITITLKGKEN